MRKRSEAVAKKSATKSATKSAQQKMPVTAETFTAGLNPEQVAVVMHDDGPARVFALAGSGKTESFARRVARLVAVRGVDPERILAVTFSKKGADEMQTRIAKKFGVAGARIGTWHSLCLQILREDKTEQATWSIQDSGPGTSPKIVLKDVLGWKGMDWKGADLAAVESFIGRCKANLYTPDSPEAADLAKRAFGWQAGQATRAFRLYNEALRDRMILTFDDFLVFAAEHLSADENARRSWASRWDYVMQDEAQDANRAQARIGTLLAQDHRNYMVIGDCYQAIYGFRGSSPEYLAQFDREWPDARTYVLPRNYRSGRTIIAAANAVVALATVDGIDVPTQMIGERDLDGAVSITCTESLDDEANVVADAIVSSTRTGESVLSDHTILFRTNAQSRALEEALLARRVPYVVVGGVSFYERKEVRDLLAYLRLAARRGRVEDIKRSINTPFRFLGARFVDKVMAAAEAYGEAGVNWAEVVEDVCERERVQSRQRASARDWVGLIRYMQGAIDGGSADEARPAALLEHVVSTTRYIDYLNKEEGGETTENSGAANVREMVRVAERFATAAELLDYIDETIASARRQREDKQAGGERVLLMSVHRSKGLEWPRVYVVGMNEMILPHAKGDDQEERRLAYVAMTRARDHLYLSHVRRIAVRAGIRDAEPSRFLLDTGLPLDAPRAVAMGAE